MLTYSSKNRILFIVIFVIILLSFILYNKDSYDKESYNTKVSRNMLDEMNTDIGVTNMKLKYCGDMCNLISPEKSIYECQLYDFTDWSSCESTGNQTRVRNVLFDFGLNCPPPSDASRLQTQTCPVDCVVGDWSDWNTCSASCGDAGVRTRSRTITTPPLNGGLSCPPVTEEEPCNRRQCCVLNENEQWSNCTENCSGGTQYRIKSILQYYNNSCPTEAERTEYRSCNTDPCMMEIIVYTPMQNKSVEFGTYTVEGFNLILDQTNYNIAWNMVIPKNTVLELTLQNSRILRYYGDDRADTEDLSYYSSYNQKREVHGDLIYLKYRSKIVNIVFKR